MKKQNFRKLDIVESKKKEMWSVLYVTCDGIIVQISWTWWSIFFFRCVDPDTSNYCYYYFADRPPRNNSPDCPFNKKLSCLRLRGSWTMFLGTGISFFTMFEYFRLASKMKVKIMEIKHQPCFLIVWVELPRLKLFNPLIAGVALI